ncbi:DUF3800 domain-containing protein [uncultured Pseudokineococcus sp.]|uniref:DUF3800 domain-containing protein n=1 Tax=uncultured Pseudokineococcus sp. TaxID=1642928 RepID=UPI0026360CAC|nr:DUF3800 domain-containing protein [uncultured Pseudokineococcus sp.]
MMTDVLLCYVDESYTDAWYFIAAVCVPGDVVASLEAGLEDVVRSAQQKHSIPGDPLELHTHELVQGKGQWSVLAAQVRTRIAIFQSALEVIAGHDVDLCVRGVDVRRQQARYSNPFHPHVVVLPHLLERVNSAAARRETSALVIADEVPGREDHRRSLYNYRQYGTPGYRPSQLGRLVDTIHFAPSSASRLLQAADLVAYLYRRHHTHAEPDVRAARAMSKAYATLEPRMSGCGTWRP